MKDRSTDSHSTTTNKLFTRRNLLKAGVAAGMGAMLSDDMLTQLFAASPTPALQPRAKSIIQIWMWGGPPHLDTFDPKPDAGSDYTGPLDKTLATNVDGIQVGQLLPQLAKLADKYSIIRSMTHGINGHETASYIVQTGKKPGGRIVYPSVGAVTSYFKGYQAGYEGLIPPYVVMTKPQGRFSEAGFLGSKYKPFATGGDPAKTPFAVEGVVSQGISAKRQRSRRALMQQLDTFSAAMGECEELSNLAQTKEQAYELILGDAGKVFDLTKEKDELREQYGRNTFGQSCLMARRLVEVGVPYITINYRGWDTHKQHFPQMNRMLPEMDAAMATLLTDLSERGLLDSTIVWWGGEFGRTPKVAWDAPWNGGRSHYGRVFSTVVAGGGFKGGQVVGASDEKGETVAERPVQPHELIASMYDLMGIDCNAKLQHPLGMQLPVMQNEDGSPIKRITEIM